MKIGIVQGRLIDSPPGKLQWFPQEDWESEFFIAASLGIENIELIAERHHNPQNPLWTDAGINRLISLSERTGVRMHTLCNDHIVDYPLIGSTAVLEQNFRLIERGKLLGCNKYVLPFFEHSELNMDNYKQYKEPLVAIADKCRESGMVVCIETILTGAELLIVLSEYDHPNIKCVFDTGNRVAFGHNLHDDILLLDTKIEHVHIKDKNKHNENVVLGTGLVNFTEVFEALGKIKYQKSYTFETNRGKNAINTAKYNIQLLKYFQSESSIGCN